MTYTTQLIARESLPIAQSIVMMLAAFVLIVLQSGTVQAQWTTGTDISNTNTGNVGIGTANPQYGKLQVNKSVRIDDDSGSANGSDTIAASPNLYLGTSAGGGQFQFNGSGGIDLWQFNGAWGRTVTFAKTGKLGIGTTAPGNRLEVVEANSPTASSVRVLSGSTSAYAGYALGRTSTEGFWGVAGGASHYANGAVAGDVVLRSESNLILANYVTPTLYLKANGNVGIGTTSPAKKLDVVGDINASGQITGGTIVAKYQDVAEWVQSSQLLPAGTVVVLDQTKSNQVIASSQPYDTRVAGVIALQPGITLGEKGTGKVLVATTGRVRIKVDASRGAINIGDLLVTSDVPGVAMKSKPIELGGVQIHRPGTLIGKALEPLSKGTGEILVLLSLQ